MAGESIGGEIMEKKLISGKLIGLIAASAVVVIALVVGLVIHFRKSEDTYRSIQIYKLDGTATIERESIGAIDAVENLYLESGDRIRVDAKSSMRLKLDDDKYILVEENSILSIVAEGTKTDSKTSIHLEQGAITNEIQSKLNENSSYDVTTPNSVMAVRGTVFRVEITVNEKGEIYTKVSVFGGKVSSRLILPDGTMKEEDVLIEGGDEVIIHMDTDITEYLSGPQSIDYEELPVQTLEFLLDVMETGTQLEGITAEEIKILLHEREEEETVEQSEEETEEETEKETEGEKAESEAEPEEEGKQAKNSKEKETAEETQETEQETKVYAAGVKTEEPSQTTGEVKTYTVTFAYNGVVFGTQTVAEGQQVNVPKLAPAAEGAWDFDFSQPIMGDVTISWK